MKSIIALTDYKNHFGSKWLANPYRSGYDKSYLCELFKSSGYELVFRNFSEVSFDVSWSNQLVIYTSSEEYGYYYKKYIEDIVSGLELAGVHLIPSINLLKANNNKVFMEILRNVTLPDELKTINAQFFGTFEESQKAVSNNQITFPCVIKIAEGAMSRGVFLAKTKHEYIKITKKISRTFNLNVWFKELLRSKKHSGYLKESLYQQKFIVQPFISGLTNDWKVLIYQNKYFVLKRSIRPNDFRASGSGFKYGAGSEAGFPTHMFKQIKAFYDALDVPNLSLDFAYDGEKGYILEFQGIHFGTSTHYRSKDYYELIDGQWILKNNELDQEQLYVWSIIQYLKRKNV